MKKERRVKKLALSRETLLRLADERMPLIGGGRSYNDTACETIGSAMTNCDSFVGTCPAPSGPDFASVCALCAPYTWTRPAI